MFKKPTKPPHFTFDGSIVRQVAGTVRGLPAKAVLERNQTTDQEDRGGSAGGVGGGGGSAGGRRDDEVFHFRWGIPEGGPEEGVTRLVDDNSDDDVDDNDNHDDDDGDDDNIYDDDGECKVVIWGEGVTRSVDCPAS